MDQQEARKCESYFEQVFTACADYSNLSRNQKSTALCVVIHAFDNIFPFLDTLSRHFHLGAVIFKGSKEVHQQVVKAVLMRGLPARPDLSRGALKRPETLLELLREINAKHDVEHLINLDYGGYFSYHHEMLSAHSIWKGKYLGVVEGTENGHQRYEELFQTLRDENRSLLVKPVISSARSLTKDCYDAHIGLSIVEGSEYALSHSSCRTLADIDRFGVLGYGKVGRSTAFYLRDTTGQGTIKVCEIDPLRVQLARRDGFETVDISSLVDESDFIFSITGNAALTASQYDAIRNSGKIIACGTSPDDELNLAKLIMDGVLSATGTACFDEAGTCVSRIYRTRNGHNLELLGDGRTINTLMSSGGDHPTLALTEGCYIAQTLALIAQSDSLYRDRISSPVSSGEDIVFRLWLNQFADGRALDECLRLSLLKAETLIALVKADGSKWDSLCRLQ